MPIAKDDARHIDVLRKARKGEERRGGAKRQVSCWEESLKKRPPHVEYKTLHESPGKLAVWKISTMSWPMESLEYSIWPMGSCGAPELPVDTCYF